MNSHDNIRFTHNKRDLEGRKRMGGVQTRATRIAWLQRRSRSKHESTISIILLCYSAQKNTSQGDTNEAEAERSRRPQTLAGGRYRATQSNTIIKLLTNMDDSSKNSAEDHKRHVKGRSHATGRPRTP